MLFPISLTITLSIWLAQIALAASRTSPPAGAFVVRRESPGSREFATVSSAINALPNDNSNQVIFIFPGTYTEQVYITRPGPLTIFGYTTNDNSFKSNSVTIEFKLSAASAGSNDASGTLRVHKDDFKMYNVNVKNTFVGSQAVAISQYGNRVGFYACSFIGFQDTVLAEQGSQVYLKGHIEGTIDFIFGQMGRAYFGGNTITVGGKGYVTASGRISNDDSSFVFNNNKIVLSSNAASDSAGWIYLGRPWEDFAKYVGTLPGGAAAIVYLIPNSLRVIFLNTEITAPLNTTVWSVWHDNNPHTENVFLADFNSTGGGISHASRPKFSTELTSSQAKAFSISSAVGSDYEKWVDASYMV